LLRNLDSLQTMTTVRRLFLDKTGTLTLERPVLSSIEPVSGQSHLTDEAAALRWAAGLARWSSHPFSKALAAAAAARQGREAGLPTMTSVHEAPGRGLSGHDPSGRLWQLGSGAWLGAPLRPTGAADDGQTEVWLACDGTVLARFSFAEALRDGAEQVLAQLRSQGMDLTLLSGDHSGRARQIADRLGIQEVLAGSDPEAKLATVRQAQAGGLPVGMVGDGINDVPVMAAADVSVAMGHAALAAQHSADAIIVSGKMTGLLDLRGTALRSMGIVRQNLIWAAVYNFVCIPLALLGWLPPWAAGLGMALSSVLVILNAQRAGIAGADL
jgi:Cu2+-exporting ATPase